MGNPESNDREITVETGREVPEPTVDVKNVKLDKGTINQIAEVLADKCPPGSDMNEWITDFADFGRGPRKHILKRIGISVAIEIPGITLEQISTNIFDIISAYKKAITDATHLIDTGRR